MPRISRARRAALSAVLLTGAMVASIAAFPVVAQADEPTTRSQDQLIYAQKVVDLTNQERRANGCPDLAANDKLAYAARVHTNDMARNNYFSHRGSNGSNGGQRISAQGYSWQTWAENIAAGYPSAEATVKGWMNSSGHRANILNCSLRDVGVGYTASSGSKYSNYVTQNFGIQR